MEQGLGSEAVMTGPIDKSKVLSVKPLRCLVPIFPPSDSNSFSSGQSFPFGFVPPNGPFASGTTSFYPFFVPNESQRQGDRNPQTAARPRPIPSPVPLNSFRSPPSVGRSGDMDGSSSKRSSKNRATSAYGDGYGNSHGQNDPYLHLPITDVEDEKSVGGRNRKSRRRSRSGETDTGNAAKVNVDLLADELLKSFKLTASDVSERGDDESMARRVLLVYHLLRRKIDFAKRPALKSATILMTRGARANVKKRVGAVPGVEVGDIFYFRMEMCLVGLHSPTMAGIDYISLKATLDEESVTVSIVSAGGYENDEDDGGGDVLIYSGHGGGVQRKVRQLMDQKLEKGNLALEKSLHRGNEVRVIRGMRDLETINSKIYVYDGLYKVHESWVEKGKSGCNVFKYKLVRIPGQPQAYILWKSIQKWKDGVTSRVGAILPDLTSGVENLPVCLVNDVDDEKGPAYFTYIQNLKYLKPFASPKPFSNCNCHGGCQSSNSNCPCIQRNGGFLPYTSSGFPVSHNLVIHECGSSCLCPPNCRNRASQSGPKFRLEVFKTKNKGWGLRSWDPIRAGAFICEYAGEVVDMSSVQEQGVESDNMHVFDATRTYELFEGVLNDSAKAPFPLIINAKTCGNVARFMNHSCSPDVYWLPVLRESNEYSYLQIGFFAIGHIPPLHELTYDYGMVQTSKSSQSKKKCLCESAKCRGYFY